MIEKVRKTVIEKGMLEFGDKVTVGVSGGADSMSLLVCLLKLKEEFGLEISAVHVNHGIRGQEALRDENYVRGFCAENGVPLQVFSFSVPEIADRTGESEEECGRRIRYECFEKVAENGKIATAHTLSDSLETVVFNILRGSGTGGLCGVPAVRGRIIRPLIDCTRQEIENFCRENEIKFVTDSTNLNSEYSRNYIRNVLMPMFAHINPSYASALRRLSLSAQSENAYLMKESDELLEKSRVDGGLSCGVLLEAHEAVSSRAVMSFIKSETGITPEYRHVSFILGLLSKDGAIQLSSEYYAVSRAGKLFTEKAQKSETEKWSKKLHPGDNETPLGIINIKYSENNINFNKKIIYQPLEYFVDCDKICGNVYLRSRKEGDKITLCKRGVTKTLKKLFTEMKIPLGERNKIPVIADDEKVLWVFSAGINRECKPDKETKRLMIIKAEVK